MDFKDAVLANLATSDFLVESYLGDLTQAELMIRPVPGANHVAWQLGHLIRAERHLVEGGVPDSMPPLPDGFFEQHSKEMAASDDPDDFLAKEDYFEIAKGIRAGTLSALEKLSAADFDKPVSGKLPPFVKTVGGCFLTVAGHWGMHSGQWVVLRRKLGRQVQF